MGCDFSQAQLPQQLEHEMKFASIFDNPLRFNRKRPDCIIPNKLNQEIFNQLISILQVDQVKLFANELEKNQVPLGIQASEQGLFESLAHMCCRYNSVLCLQYLLTRVYFQTEMYISFINAQNFQGLTALHVATQFDSKDCFNLLLKYGGLNLRLRTQTGSTPLSMASIFRRTNHVDILNSFQSRSIRFLKLSHDFFNQNTYTRIYTEQLPQGKRRLRKMFEQTDYLAQYDSDASEEIKEREKQQEQKLRKKLQREEQLLRKRQEELKKQQQQRKLQLEKKLGQQKRKAAEALQLERKKAEEQIKRVLQEEGKKKIREQLKRKELEAAQLLRKKQQEEKKQAQEQEQKIKKKAIQQRQRRQKQLIEERKRLQEQKKQRQKQEQENRKKEQEEKMRRIKKQQEEQRRKKEEENLSIIQKQRKMLEKQMEEERKRLALKQKEQAMKQVTVDPTKNIHGVCPNECLSLYNSIKDNFVDKQFPPELNTIGQNVPSQLKNSVWLRPNQIFKSYCVFENVDFEDIKQGALGVCYYLATLSSLAQYPERITSIFTFYDMKKGFYVLKFFEMGKEKYVVVDDYIPCYKSSKRPLFTNTMSQQIWVMILQKAWVKQFGNYLRAQAMSPDTMMENLTGAPSKGLWINNKSVAEVFKELYQYHQQEYIIVLTSKSKDAPEGIVACHAYSLNQVINYKGNKLYKIRNPWGSFEWKGVFSDNSNKWTNQLKQALNHKTDDNDGTFIMTEAQITLGFQYVSIGMTKKNYVPGIPTSLSSALDQNLFYTFQISTKGKVNLRVCQPFDRFLNDKNYKYSPLLFEVIGIDNKKLLAQGQNKAYWGGKSVNCIDDAYLELNPGKYLIRIKFFWKNPNKYHQANLCSYTSEPLFFTKINQHLGWDLWQQGLIGTYSEKVGNDAYLFKWNKGQAVIYVKKQNGSSGINFTFDPSQLKNCKLGLRKTSDSVLRIEQNQIGTLDKIIPNEATSAGTFYLSNF